MRHVAYRDTIGGLNGAAALLVALNHLAHTGKGQFVDLSQADALLPLGVHGIRRRLFVAIRNHFPLPDRRRRWGSTTRSFLGRCWSSARAILNVLSHLASLESDPG